MIFHGRFCLTVSHCNTALEGGMLACHILRYIMLDVSHCKIALDRDFYACDNSQYVVLDFELP